MIFECQNLQMTYPNCKNTTLHNISTEIYEGQIIGLVGHNGAGKTTLIKIICGLITPSSFDKLYINKNIKKSIILNANQLYDDLTILENIKFYFSLYNKRFDADEVDLYLKKIMLYDYKDYLVSSLSTGQKQKVNLVRTLLVDSRLLVLDEPTSGLDPISRFEFHQLLLSIAHEKKLTIIFCSHIISEIEKMCSDIWMLHGGEIVKKDKIENIFNEYTEYVLEVEISNNNNEMISLIESLPKEMYVKTLLLDKIIYIIQECDLRQEDIQAYDLESFTKRKTTLEDIYLFINRSTYV
ncbi:hypothetical protein BG262_03560 [Floricoccus penangensis]|uniref:ABC transporter domain-containing protein n=1 Tax=Floricoccus penangensis TaxID=1859475 RepID=A0A9Q5P0F2_9LACT|nr:ABC transporter ATP-binding protein [Floricoccus penangensis]OFI46881.1 hypothetical protein BG262_03560 [Floricoccus penangensis]